MSSPVSNGEFHFTLTEKIDRNKHTYLFVGLKMFNSVLLIWPEEEVPGQPRRWKAVLKPYSGPSRDNASKDASEFEWDTEDTNRQGDRDERPSKESNGPKAGRRPR